MTTPVMCAVQVKKAFSLPSAEGILRMVAMMNTGERDEQNRDAQEDHIGRRHTDHIDGDVSTGQLQDSQDLTGEVVDDVVPTEGQLNCHG